MNIQLSSVMGGLATLGTKVYLQGNKEGVGAALIDATAGFIVVNGLNYNFSRETAGAVTKSKAIVGIIINALGGRLAAQFLLGLCRSRFQAAFGAVALLAGSFIISCTNRTTRTEPETIFIDGDLNRNQRLKEAPIGNDILTPFTRSVGLALALSGIATVAAQVANRYLGVSIRV